MTLEERGRNIQETCRMIRIKQEAAAHELSKLELVADLLLRGVDPETISTFGFAHSKAGGTLIHHKDGTSTAIHNFDLSARLKSLGEMSIKS